MESFGSSMQTNARAFWTTNELPLYLLRFLNLLDLLRFGHLNHRAEAFTKMYLKGRVTRYTAPFFPPGSLESDGTNSRLVRFFQVLEDTRSWIVGSVPLGALSVLSDVPQPDNLNIIALHNSLEQWMSFFVMESRFTVDTNVVAFGAYEAEGRRYITFVHEKKPGFRITLTTAYAEHLGHLFFAAPNTDQRVAIAAYQVITPYLQAVADQEHIIGMRPRCLQYPGGTTTTPDDSTYRTVSPFPGATSLMNDTSHYKGPCGPACTGRWRFARTLKGIARIKWGGMDGMDYYLDSMLEQIGKTRMQYRLGVKCLNGRCREEPT